MMQLKALSGSHWTGEAELWRDPMGDVVDRSPCTITIGDAITAEHGVIHYTWSLEGTAHQGQLEIQPGGARFTDSWHQKDGADCADVPAWGAMVSVRCAYAETWGWRITLCFREPTGQLVLQMTNVTPWGEEARAVRMACKRAESAEA